MDLVISDFTPSSEIAPPFERWWLQRGESGEREALAQLARHSNLA